MGRSVETKGNHVVYFDVSEMPELHDWENLVDNIRYVLEAKYISFYRVNKWIPYPYRENNIILENGHIQISISEYCGCAAISVFVRDDIEFVELAENWLNQCWNGISKTIKGVLPNSMVRLGTFSNGGAVFRKE